MGLFRRDGGSAGDAAAAAAVPVRRGERILAVAAVAAAPAAVPAAAEREARGTVVATTYDLAYLATDGQLIWRRPWYHVDTGSWSQSEESLEVTWMGDLPAERWTVTGNGRLLTVFRERVQASVVLGTDVEVAGRRVARVVLRKDLATGEMVEQVKWRRGPRPSGAIADEAADAVARAQLRLRDEVGLI